MAKETAAQKKARIAREKKAALNPNMANQDASTLTALGLTPQYLQSLVQQAATGSGNSSTTSTSSSVTKLTTNTARALMQEAATAAGYTGTFSAADVTDFMNQFNAKQNAQIEKIITTARTKIVPNSDPKAVQKIVEETARQEFPSFFKPADFASDFIWGKIDFKNEASLGAKSLDALAQVRGLIDSFQLIGISDSEAKAAAKQIAMGKKTIQAYTVELQQLAKKEYPQFSDRFAIDPTLTTYDIASPIINMLAKTWQVDPKSIKMDNPIVSKWLHFAGPDGKGKQPSYNDLLIMAKNDPQYDLTTEANDNARNAATSLARALGYGV